MRIRVSDHQEVAMDATAQTTFTIGAEASCTDGACGHVSHVVVNPIARTVTHLVVDPTDHRGPGRLVPLDLIDATTGQIRLRCTLAEFKALRPAEETEFMPGTGYLGHPGYGPNQVHCPPLYALRLVGVVYDLGEPIAPREVPYDSLPLGEVETYRGESVYATDGEIGRVEGLVVEPGGHHVTHVLLQEGHMLGRKDVAIPIRAVTKLGGLIELSITKQQVKGLPPVNIDRPAR
jgi:sporulation protein YlmC with PRC-barrel domain